MNIHEINSSSCSFRQVSTASRIPRIENFFTNEPPITVPDELIKGINAFMQEYVEGVAKRELMAIEMSKNIYLIG